MNNSQNNMVLNEKEAARYINMSVHFLRQARCDGPTAGRTPGPVYLKLGKSVRYHIEDLNEWLSEHRQGITAKEV